MSSPNDRWYPNAQRLKTPSDSNAVFKEVLDRHYALQERVDALEGGQAAPAENNQRIISGGPATTMMLGLPVGPADPRALPNGATLKYVKASGLFLFS